MKSNENTNALPDNMRTFSIKVPGQYASPRRFGSYRKAIEMESSAMKSDIYWRVAMEMSKMQIEWLEKFSELESGIKTLHMGKDSKG